MEVWRHAEPPERAHGRHGVRTGVISQRQARGSCCTASVDRARQIGISQDAQLWRDAGALSAKQASKIKASKLGEEKNQTFEYYQV